MSAVNIPRYCCVQKAYQAHNTRQHHQPRPAPECYAGSVSTSQAERRRLAKLSLENSCKTASFVRIFPEYQERLFEERRQGTAAALGDRDGGVVTGGAVGNEDVQLGAEPERPVLDVPGIMRWAMPVTVAAVAAAVVCAQIALSNDAR